MRNAKMKLLVTSTTSALLLGCSTRATKPDTMREWMHVPAEQRLADPAYVRHLIEQMRNDPVLYRVIEERIREQERR